MKVTDTCDKINSPAGPQGAVCMQAAQLMPSCSTVPSGSSGSPTQYTSQQMSGLVDKLYFVIRKIMGRCLLHNLGRSAHNHR